MSSSCTPAVQGLDPSLRAMVITQYNNDTYTTSLANGALTVSAPSTNEGSNNRVVFMRTGDTPSFDHTACATWSSASGSAFHQEGITLRTAPVEGHRKAVIITKNVWAAEYHKINVHVLDTTVNPDPVQVASHDMSAALGQGSSLKPFPWRVCARMRGDSAELVVVPLTPAPTYSPTFGDPVHSRATRVSAPWAGVPGWWVGHLVAGSSVSFTYGASTP